MYSSPTDDKLPKTGVGEQEEGWNATKFLMNTNFYEGFMPRRVDLSGPLLERLDFDASNFPIRKRRTKFALSMQVQK